MSAAILTFIIILMLPIYTGWLLLLAAPFMAITTLMAGFVVSRLVHGLRSINMSIHRARRNALFQYDEIDISDDGSPLVDFSKNFPGLLLRAGERPVWGRIAVGEMLLEAQMLLPHGYQLMVSECFRSKDTQAKMRAASIQTMRSSCAFFSDQNAAEEFDRLDSEFQYSGSNSGGAFDITIVDGSGQSIDLGAQIQSSLRWFGWRIEPNPSIEIKANRKILFDALAEVGFVGFSTEWWHWSYGDRHWCSAKKFGTAIYGDIEPQNSGSSRMRVD